MARPTEYWRIVFNIVPYMCNPITYSAVISERVESFLRKQKDKCILIAAVKVDEHYHARFAHQNPSKECYPILKQSDYGKYE